MAEKLKCYTIILDGIDKSGKDTIAKYIWHLDKRLNVFVRGWPSLVVYAKKFNRNCNYELPWKEALYVYCTVEKDDWKIRCSITNEDMTTLCYEKDKQLFDDAFNELHKNNYITMIVNTSKMTPCSIAKKIVKKIHELNGENNEQKEKNIE